MNCDVCHRHHHAQRLPFLCAVDVRNQLYELRLAHALVLLQNEQLEAQVNAALGQGGGGGGGGEEEHKDSGSAAARVRYDVRESERKAMEERTRAVAVRAEQLRATVEATRAAVAARREALQQRRADLAAAANGTAARRARVLGEVERATAMTRFRWNHKYDAMAATRAFLCMEAAKLYGLRRVRRPASGAVVGGYSHGHRHGRHTYEYAYELGGLAVVDPYNLNNLPAEVISTSLAHITHILLLACHYLAIRLPAEITLPHRDYPRPTVFTLLSSYAHGDVPFPGTALLVGDPSSSSARANGNSNSNNNSRSNRMPRPRPLFIDKALPLLAKEDGAAHTMFLEGLALLAYDVAWACCSQGVPVVQGDGSGTGSDKKVLPFDDVFNIGRNLYNLLIGHQRLNNPAQRIFGAAQAASGTGTGMGTGTGTTTTISPPTTASPSPTDNAMGRYAHGTAHTFLGDTVMQTFKLPSPNRLADRLKTKLSSESTMPDWEVLEDDAWAVDDGADGAGGADGHAPAGGGDSPPEKRLFGVESISTVITSLDDTASEAGSSSGGRTRSSGTSGWTKVRNR